MKKGSTQTEAQLTFRALAVGCSIGALVTAMNLYFGLRTGWSIGGSLIAAILSYSLFQALNPKQPFGVLETNIAQTAGSAAGSMTSAAGLIAAIPAMKMLGYELSIPELFIWAISIAYLGVFFAVPLRRQMVIIEKLRFPTGTATAETIQAIFATGEEAMKKSKTLLYMAAVAAFLTLASYFISPLGHPPIMKWIGLGVVSAWGFSVLISPMMFGAGILIGPRVGLSLLLGSILSWGVLGPLSMQLGWTSGEIMSYETGPRGWLLWPGVALMVTDALMSLGLSSKAIINSFKKNNSLDGEAKDHDDVIPKVIWMGGLVLATAAVMFSAYFVFDIHPLHTLLAVFLSSILSIIAVRSTGETDINPIGGMGKVTQLIFGALSPGNVSTNLMSAAITGSGATQAGDMMQDLKTGHLLGASPYKQFKAQCVGIFVGMLVCIPVYKLFDTAYVIGEGDLPAPAAHAWKAMAQLLSEGADALPPAAGMLVVGGIVLGVILSLLKTVDAAKPYLPSGLAMGIAFIVPAYYSVAMCIGSIFLVYWQKKNAASCKSLSFSVASGLVAGEGLMGVVVAVLTLVGIKPWL
ncbi:MAG: OPT family oligopeptide transporter [Bdellovibrionales bacterium]